MKPLHYACLLLLLASCRKHSHTPTNTINPGNLPVIYVTGSNGTNPVLWKDDSAEVLSTSAGYGEQVLVAGTDVYVAGVCNVSSESTPAGPFGQYLYWKNGTPHNFDGSMELLYASSIAVNGNGVYFASHALWENGNVLSLPGWGTASRIRAMQAVGGDLYVAGSDSVGDAVYWLDGVLHVVSQGYYPRFSSGGDPEVGAFYVSGSDVYMTGFDMNRVPVYWKNGIPDTLKTAEEYITQLNSIFVSGSDVYVAGSVLGSKGWNLPVYWKNGVETVLPFQGTMYGGSANAIVYYSGNGGTHLFVAGDDGNGAALWEDGIETMLSAKGVANGIYVAAN